MYESGAVKMLRLKLDADMRGGVARILGADIKGVRVGPANPRSA